MRTKDEKVIKYRNMLIANYKKVHNYPASFLSPDLDNWIQTGQTKSSSVISIIKNLRKALRTKTPSGAVDLYKACRSPRQYESLFKSLNGTLPGPWVGIEIECVVDAGFDLCSHFPDENWKQTHSDCSIRPAAGSDEQKALEVTILATMTNVASRVKKICAALKQGNAYVNTSCGLHVHLDCRSYSKQHVYTTLYRHFLRALPWLTLMLSPSRLQNSYCVNNLQPSPSTSRGSQSRYKMINRRSFNEFGTLEIRMHQGSVDPDRICSWVTLLQEIKNSRRYIPSWKAAITGHLLPAETQNYIASRILRFHPELAPAMRECRPELIDLIMPTVNINPQPSEKEKTDIAS